MEPHRSRGKWTDKTSSSKRISGPPTLRKKKKWVSEHKLENGSLQEGLGFAFRRKEKVKHNYNKLRKQHKIKQDIDVKDTFPGYLKHLYLAEEQKQRNKSQTQPEQNVSARSDHTEASVCSTPSQLTEECHKRKRSGSSHMKTKEHFQKQQEERLRRKEAFQRHQLERDQALQKYKEKKKATYEMLRKKTKKGQPRLNAQIELLLQKIEATKK